MNIGQAVQAIGREETHDDELAIARVHNGRMLHATLAECRDRPLERLRDVWIAAGTFRRGSIQTFAGRTRENLSRVIDLSFDFDLTDFTGASKHDIHHASDADIAIYLRGMATDAEELLSLAGIPFTFSVGTGYGLLYVSRLCVPDQARLSDAQSLYAGLVDRINELHGGRIVDPQVKDAGTRLIRLPGCVNTKGPVPRPCMIIEERGDLLHLDDFEVTERVSVPPRRIIPAHGKELSEDDERDIILALNGEWVEGSRHGIALGIAGILAKSGVPEPQAIRIVQESSSGDTEVRDRLTAVATTYSRVGSGLDVRGYHALRDFLSPDALAFIDSKLSDRYQTQSLGVIEFPLTEEREARAPRQAFSACPEEAFYGWFGAYREIMKPTTEACDAFHLGTALAYAGSCVGRRVSTYLGAPLFPNLYLLLVGETGRSRKDTAMGRGNFFFTSSHNPSHLMMSPFHTLRGVTSGEGLIDYLAESPHTLLYLSELSTMVRRARRQGTLTLMPTLIELWDAPPRVDIPRAGKDTTKCVDEPFLSLLGATTPETLAEDMSGADIESGFANRMLWFFGQATGALDDPPPPDGQLCARLYGELRHAIETYRVGTVLTKDARAKEVWRAWYRAWHEMHHASQVSAQLAQRMGANIHKVALIYAISDGAREITDDHLSSAIALVEWAFENVSTQARRWGWDAEAKIASQIREALWCGPLSNRELFDVVGERVSPTVLFRTLDAMAKTGQVRMVAKGTFALND